jgi:hypothetical protein
MGFFLKRWWHHIFKKIFKFSDTRQAVDRSHAKRIDSTLSSPVVQPLLYVFVCSGVSQTYLLHMKKQNKATYPTIETAPINISLAPIMAY